MMFCNLYSEKTKEKILTCSSQREVSPAYRLIRHSPDDPIVKEDFYPSIMERNNGVMPSYEEQDRKTKISNFGVSVFVDENALDEYVQCIPSERNIKHFVAKGSIKSTYGTASNTDERGHIDMFLFDPVQMNCYELYGKND